jgi:hypothetical protein
VIIDPDSYNYYLKFVTSCTSILSSRTADTLPSDSKTHHPVKTATVLREIAKGHDRFCDPFFVKVLTGEDLRKEMPPWVKPYFSASGHQGDMGQLERGDKKWTGSEQLVMEMVLRLNLVNLKHAHVEGLASFHQIMGKPMPKEQLIVKFRPDALPKSETWFALGDLQKIARKKPLVFFTEYHPVWGLQGEPSMCYVKPRYN